MKYDDPLHVLDDLTGSEDDLLGSVRDLFPAEEAKKESPRTEGSKQNKLRLHYTQIPAKGQVPGGLYLVGRTAALEGAGLKEGSPC